MRIFPSSTRIKEEFIIIKKICFVFINSLIIKYIKIFLFLSILNIMSALMIIINTYAQLRRITYLEIKDNKN